MEFCSGFGYPRDFIVSLVGTFSSISVVVSAVVAFVVVSVVDSVVVISKVASVVVVSVVNSVVVSVVVISVVVVDVVVSGIFVVISCIIGNVSWGPTVVDGVIFVVVLHLRLQIHGLTCLQLQLNGPLLQLEPQPE